MRTRSPKGVSTSPLCARTVTAGVIGALLTLYREDYATEQVLPQLDSQTRGNEEEAERGQSSMGLRLARAAPDTRGIQAASRKAEARTARVQCARHRRPAHHDRATIANGFDGYKKAPVGRRLPNSAGAGSIHRGDGTTPARESKTEVREADAADCRAGRGARSRK